uniref:Uncharacterized protein n=1 Tax=Cannabis sativa TaxID=3483 RepID=A0A803P4L8_CANSA
MAKTRAKVQGKIQVSTKKKKKGPNSTADAKKTKSMEEILGVEPMEFTDEEDGVVAAGTEDAEEPDPLRDL